MSNTVTVAQAKIYQRDGMLTGCYLHRHGDAWFVNIQALGVANIDLALADARTRSPRPFKNLDVAITTLRDIGIEPTMLIARQ